MMQSANFRKINSCFESLLTEILLKMGAFQEICYFYKFKLVESF